MQIKVETDAVRLGEPETAISGLRKAAA